MSDKSYVQQGKHLKGTFVSRCPHSLRALLDESSQVFTHKQDCSATL